MFHSPEPRELHRNRSSLVDKFSAAAFALCMLAAVFVALAQMFAESAS